MLEPNVQRVSPLERRRCYGLPCVKCHTYYFADLDACPVCRSRDRIGRPAVSVQDVEPPVTDKATASPAASRIAVETGDGQIASCWSAILGKSTPPTRTISAGEFRTRCVQVLEEVGSSRATILVTKRGRPVARIVPPEAAAELPVSTV